MIKNLVLSLVASIAIYNRKELQKTAKLIYQNIDTILDPICQSKKLSSDGLTIQDNALFNQNILHTELDQIKEQLIDKLSQETLIIHYNPKTSTNIKKVIDSQARSIFGQNTRIITKQSSSSCDFQTARDIINYVEADLNRAACLEQGFSQLVDQRQHHVYQQMKPNFIQYKDVYSQYMMQILKDL